MLANWGVDHCHRDLAFCVWQITCVRSLRTEKGNLFVTGEQVAGGVLIAGTPLSMQKQHPSVLAVLVACSMVAWWQCCLQCLPEIVPCIQ
mmetsp:Transcript_45834/g.93805  ORF Transcript_45834/g.93805 Transcript_45834/m.93805 type:complete len:90 (-) Transcript_45834:600-869(-)